MQPILFSLAAICVSLSAQDVDAGTDPAGRWPPLIEARKYDEAKTLCEGWLKGRSGASTLAEAHKCLANVELARAESIRVAANSEATALTPGFGGPGVDRALEHLNAAVSLAPNDLSIHQGRLHVLLRAGRYDDLSRVVESSIRTYGKKDGVDVWLPYSDELRELGEFRAGLAYSKVLERYFPGDHRTVANVGAFLASLKRDREALVYAKKAVQMKPEDPIDLWNLAVLTTAAGRNSEADDYYRKSLRFERDVEVRHTRYCAYTDFLEHKLKELDTACELQKRHCPPERQTACAPR